MPRVQPLELGFDPVVMEDRHFGAIDGDCVACARAENRKELSGSLGDLFIVDHDPLNIAGEHVADGANHQIGFAVELGGRFFALDAFVHRFPEPHEVVQIGLKLAFGVSHRGSACDESHVLGKVEIGHLRAELVARVGILDLARHAGTLHAGQHHQESPGNAQVGRQCRAFGSDAFLDDLNQNLLAAPQAALDGRPVAPGRLAADPLGLGSAVGEMLGVNVGDVQEPVLGQAEVDESGLDAGLDVGDAAFVDVADVILR